jgi:hypothetical protein
VDDLMTRAKRALDAERTRVRIERMRKESERVLAERGFPVAPSPAPVPFSRDPRIPTPSSAEAPEEPRIEPVPAEAPASPRPEERPAPVDFADFIYGHQPEQKSIDPKLLGWLKKLPRKQLLPPSSVRGLARSYALDHGQESLARQRITELCREAEKRGVVQIPLRRRGLAK